MLSRKVKIALGIMAILFLIATAGYMVLENYSIIEALYMTAITFTTIGYGEVKPLSETGRLFTVIIALAGVSVLLITIAFVSQDIIDVQLRKILGRRKLEKEALKLKGHYIICGYGRMGKLIANELHQAKIPFVIVEVDEERCQEIEEKGYIYIRGDATQEEVLEKAGIRNAKGLVSVVGSDADNVFIVLTARGLNRGLYILSRAVDESTERKLKIAGADKVCSPYKIGGMRIALSITKPHVVDFLEVVTGSSQKGLWLEELKVSEEHKDLIGKTLSESGIKKRFGSMVLAVKNADGKMIFNPPSEYLIKEGDVLILLGNIEELEKIEREL